jgi:hypothetical protein
MRQRQGATAGSRHNNIDAMEQRSRGIYAGTSHVRNSEQCVSQEASRNPMEQALASSEGPSLRRPLATLPKGE